MNINEKIKLLPVKEQGRFHLELIDCLYNKAWCKKYNIDTSSDERYNRAMEKLFDEKYNSKIKHLFVGECEELDLKSLPKVKIVDSVSLT
jgi:hypothetical protein